MSERILTPELRNLVVERAGHVCAYCLIHQDDTVFGCHVDHIISLKHGGPTSVENLALACVFCNRAKGSDIASVLDPRAPSQTVRLFHPRLDRWNDHFSLADDAITIVPLTDVGQVTARLLRLNDPQRLLERQALTAVGRYPAPPQPARSD